MKATAEQRLQYGEGMSLRPCLLATTPYSSFLPSFKESRGELSRMKLWSFLTLLLSSPHKVDDKVLMND